MTFLCIPEQKRKTSTTDDKANSGCNISDSRRGTIEVRGSVSQYQAPIDTAMAAITRTTKNKVLIVIFNKIKSYRNTYFSIVMLMVAVLATLLSIVFQRL